MSHGLPQFSVNCHCRPTPVLRADHASNKLILLVRTIKKTSLVGGIPTHLKNISQLGLGLSSAYRSTPAYDQVGWSKWCVPVPVSSDPKLTNEQHVHHVLTGTRCSLCWTTIPVTTYLKSCRKSCVSKVTLATTSEWILWCHLYNLVGGIPTPLKNMKVSWDDEIPNIWKVIGHVPNHQPVIVCLDRKSCFD
jgi:hypothetical protein